MTKSYLDKNTCKWESVIYPYIYLSGDFNSDFDVRPTNTLFGYTSSSFTD